MSADQTEQITIEQILADPFGVAAIEAAALWQLDDPVRYGVLIGALGESDITARRLADWKASVRIVYRALRDTRREEERVAKREEARKLVDGALEEGRPVFERGSNAELARRLYKHYQSPQGVPPATGYGDLWAYEDKRGLWSRVDSESLSVTVQSWDGALISPPEGAPEIGQLRTLQINSELAACRMALALSGAFGQGPEWFEDPPRGLAFADQHLMVTGIGDHTRLERAAHSPEHRLKVGFDFSLPTQREHTPLFEQYLESIWAGCDDMEDRQRFLQEFAGASLVGVAPLFGRALILTGKKGTGKGTLIKVLDGLFPEGAVSHVKPHEWEDDSKVYDLAWARFNSVYELNIQNPINDSTRIKEIVFGEPVQIRPPYRANAMSLRCQAGHLFSANRLPRIYGGDDALWDRWAVLEMDGRDWRASSSRIKDLDQLIIEQELPGVVAWALEGAHRLLKQGEYTWPESVRAQLQAWKREADPVAEWFAERCEESEVESKGLVFFNDFTAWATERNYGKLGQRTFYERLETHCSKRRTMRGIEFGAKLIGAA